MYQCVASQFAGGGDQLGALHVPEPQTRGPLQHQVARAVELLKRADLDGFRADGGDGTALAF